jgi:hypothetical protein
VKFKISADGPVYRAKTFSGEARWRGLINFEPLPLSALTYGGLVLTVLIGQRVRVQRRSSAPVTET